jgi:hypothetical protein
MPLLTLLLIVFAAGAAGGAVNAYLSDNGFIGPRTDENGGRKIYRPGFIGNVVVGGVAASISWGLYGPFAAVSIIGGTGAGSSVGQGLTLSALVGAALVGIAGARWLTNEVDKKMLRATASEAIAAAPKADIARKLLTEPPAKAWQIAADEAALVSR